MQLIEVVLFGVQAYWAQIFLIPKKVMKIIGQMCRTFLRTAAITNSRKTLISWETICFLVVACRLNVMNLDKWKTTAILKLLWNLARKKGMLMEPMDSNIITI